jgi:hypothetical protein
MVHHLLQHFRTIHDTHLTGNRRQIRLGRAKQSDEPAGKKIGEQLNSLRVSSYSINYTEYNSEGLGILADLKYDLFD